MGGATRGARADALSQEAHRRLHLEIEFMSNLCYFEEGNHLRHNFGTISDSSVRKIASRKIYNFQVLNLLQILTSVYNMRETIIRSVINDQKSNYTD